MTQEMKKYTGTKTIKAMPMTMDEAYERKFLNYALLIWRRTEMSSN